jgi:hypothetical protein
MFTHVHFVFEEKVVLAIIAMFINAIIVTDIKVELVTIAMFMHVRFALGE